MAKIKQKSIKLKDVIEQIYQLTKINKQDIKSIINEYETIIASELLDKGIIKLALLGTAVVKVRQTRVGVDLQNEGKKVIIPGKAVPKFKFSKSIRDLVATNISVDSLQNDYDDDDDDQSYNDNVEIISH